MKRKASSLLLTAAFLLVVFCPHILWRAVSGQDEGENSEKRTLAERPAFSMEAIDAYPKAFEEYYNDHLPFRDLLIKLYNSMQYHVFRTSSNDDVILGKDGWLFYSSVIDGTSMQCYDGSLLFTDEELAQIADHLTDTKKRLAEQGTEFVVFIAPSKARIYSEYMPDYLGEPAQMCMVNQVIAYLESHTDLTVVYPYEEMIAHKKAHPEQLLYYQTDTHWNDLGAYIGARALLTALGIEIPSADQLDIMVQAPGRYDLAKLLTVWGIGDRGNTVVINSYPDQKLKTISNEFNGRMEFEMQDAPDLRLFMHKDSFGSGMAPHLKYHLSRALLVHNIVYDAKEVWEEKPDVFVLEVTERYIRRLRNPVL